MAAITVAAPPASGAEERRTAPACFAPEALRALPSERVPVKGPRKFDNDVPSRALAPFEPVAGGLRARAVRAFKLPAGRKLIALTFDFCEQTGEIAGYDGAILDTLRAERVKATLFVGGKWMRSHQERTRQLIADPLFEFANHGWSHKNLRLLDGGDLQREVSGPLRAYEAAREDLAKEGCVSAGATHDGGGPAPRMSLFRFPFGACNAASLKVVNELGLVPIQWSVSTGDAAPTQSAAAITASVLRAARPGAIVLMHGNGRGHNTAAALPQMIAKLRALGYGFATVGELMALGEPELAETCYDARPGDTDRYDMLFPARPARSSVPKANRDGLQASTVQR